MPGTDFVDPAAAAAHLAACVREAGQLALSMFRTSVNQWNKAGSSPVSDADIAVDRLLREQLTGAFPGVAWLSEESADDYRGSPRVTSGLSTRLTEHAPFSRTCRIGRFRRRWSKVAARSPLACSLPSLKSFSWHPFITAPRATAPQFPSRLVHRLRGRASPDRGTRCHD